MVQARTAELVLTPGNNKVLMLVFRSMRQVESLGGATYSPGWLDAGATTTETAQRVTMFSAKAVDDCGTARAT